MGKIKRFCDIRNRTEDDGSNPLFEQPTGIRIHGPWFSQFHFPQKQPTLSFSLCPFLIHSFSSFVSPTSTTRTTTTTTKQFTLSHSCAFSSSFQCPFSPLYNPPLRFTLLPVQNPHRFSYPFLFIFYFFFTYLTLFSSVFPLQKTIFSCIFFPVFSHTHFP